MFSVIAVVRDVSYLTSEHKNLINTSQCTNVHPMIHHINCGQQKAVKRHRLGDKIMNITEFTQRL